MDRRYAELLPQGGGHRCRWDDLMKWRFISTYSRCGDPLWHLSLAGWVPRNVKWAILRTYVEIEIVTTATPSARAKIGASHVVSQSVNQEEASKRRDPEIETLSRGVNNIVPHCDMGVGRLAGVYTLIS